MNKFEEIRLSDEFCPRDKNIFQKLYAYINQYMKTRGKKKKRKKKKTQRGVNPGQHYDSAHGGGRHPSFSSFSFSFFFSDFWGKNSKLIRCMCLSYTCTSQNKMKILSSLLLFGRLVPFIVTL